MKRLVVPEEVEAQMRLWRLGARNLPQEYIKLHQDAALRDLDTRVDWLLIHRDMVDDGWADGMRFTRVIARVEGELVELKWNDAGNWMKNTGHGWALFARGAGA